MGIWVVLLLLLLVWVVVRYGRGLRLVGSSGEIAMGASKRGRKMLWLRREFSDAR